MDVSGGGTATFLGGKIRRKRGTRLSAVSRLGGKPRKLSVDRDILLFDDADDKEALEYLLLCCVWPDR